MIQFTWNEIGDPISKLEGKWVTILEARRVIERAQLLGHCFLDFLARMTGAAGPKTAEAVVNSTTLIVDQPTTLGGDNYPRIPQEISVGGKG
ncbi:hypothetical protein PRtIB026_A34540 [Pseudomonas sp. RtIB026]|nr:hypothetical protein PRtIB026_A34540 [Pseudomonas sp. RtIB026]